MPSKYLLTRSSYCIEMPSLRTLLPAILTLATRVTAADNCPENWFENHFHVTRCCFGNMMIEDTDAYCCIYDVTAPAEETDSSTATSIDWSTADSCFSKIPFTASDYSSQVYAASSKIVATATTTAAGTMADPSTTSEATPASTNSGSSSSTNSGAEPTTTNAAMPAVTADGIVIGGAAVAVALLAQ